MKGIVAEVNGKNAVILLQDGTFRKVRASSHMTTGSEIDIGLPAGNARVIRLATRVASIAAAAILAIGISYGAYCYTLPYSYVDVDINPSVELTANVFDRIIKVEALNDEAEDLLAEHSLKNSRLDDGVSRLLNMAAEHGYLNVQGQSAQTVDSTPGAVNSTDPGDENTVLVTVSSANIKKSEELKKKIVYKATVELDKVKIKSDVLAGEASIEQRDDARALGVTPGKLALIEDAMEDRPELKLDELKKSPVKDLLRKAIDKRKAAEAAKKDTAVKQNDNGKAQEGRVPEKTGPQTAGQNHGNQQGKGADAETKVVYDQTGTDVSGQDQSASVQQGSASQVNQGSNKNAGNASDKSHGKGQEDKKDINSNKIADKNAGQARDQKITPSGQAGKNSQEARKDLSKKLRDELIGQKEKYSQEKGNNNERDQGSEKSKGNDKDKQQARPNEQGKSSGQDQRKESPVKQQDSKNGNGGHYSSPSGGKSRGNGSGNGNRH